MSINDNDLVRIREATDSNRPRYFHVNKRFVSVAPTSGETVSENRVLLQPPQQPVNIAIELMEQRSVETQQLLNILKATKNWVDNNVNTEHPFYNYLNTNKDMNKGWIRIFLPNDIKSDNKQLTAK